MSFDKTQSLNYTQFIGWHWQNYVQAAAGKIQQKVVVENASPLKVGVQSTTMAPSFSLGCMWMLEMSGLVRTNLIPLAWHWI